MMKVIALTVFSFVIFGVRGGEPIVDKWERMEEVKTLVGMWSSQIGAKLTELSREMIKEEAVKESFRCLETKLVKEDAAILVHDIALNIRAMMDSKAQGVRNIAEYAEFLSYHRSKKPIFQNSTYYFYNADNLTNTESDPEKEARLSEEILNVSRTPLRSSFKSMCEQGIPEDANLVGETRVECK